MIRGCKNHVYADLFACKLHAAIYRAWKNRVKGRDWYDVVWFIRKGVPLNLGYLAKCMQNNNELGKDEALSSARLSEIFTARLKTLNIEDAKEDVGIFLRDNSQLSEWSHDFFKYWFSKIKYL